MTLESLQREAQGSDLMKAVPSESFSLRRTLHSARRDCRLTDSEAVEALHMACKAMFWRGWHTG